MGLTPGDQLRGLARDHRSRLEALPGTEALATSLDRELECIDAPMRVAVIGRIKTGKSTLINALLGRELLATDQLELTYNVNRLRYGEEEGLTVHFRDGGEPRDYEIDELVALTSRDGAASELVRRIDYVEVRYPFEHLRLIDLIDTPGLGSVYREDSDNTLRWLGLTEGDVSRASGRAAYGADALVYTISRTAGESDLDAVVRLQRQLARRSRPINAIGVINRVDESWAPGGDDPFALAARRAAALLRDSDLRLSLYAVVPVSAKLALGASLLDDADLDLLRQLASEDPGAVADDLLDLDDFLDREPKAARRRLNARLGRYGIWRAVELIREGATEAGELGGALREASGLPELERLLYNHFGWRAETIKAGGALDRLFWECQELRSRVTEDEREAVRDLQRDTEKALGDLVEIAEVELIADARAGLLDLRDEEHAELLRVCGDEGPGVLARLGLSPEPGQESRVLLEAAIGRCEARIHYWYVRRDQGSRGRSEEVADRLAAIYERLIDEVRAEFGDQPSG